MNEPILHQEILDLIESRSQECIGLLEFEIWHLMKTKCTKSDILEAICVLEQRNLILRESTGFIFSNSQQARSLFKNRELSSAKIHKAKIVLDLMSKLPTVNFIGITGTAAFSTMKVVDDLDILVIVSRNTIFVTRIMLACISAIFGVRRSRTTQNSNDTICINIILENDSLAAPYPKRSLYSARELVSIRKYYDRECYFDRLQSENLLWMQDILPNIGHDVHPQKYLSHEKGSVLPDSHIVVRFLNWLLGSVQLWFMKPKVTNELISQKQLWLHPNTRQKWS